MAGFTPPKNSALLSFAKRAESEKRQKAKVEFSTYELAIEEILRLQDQVDRGRLAIAVATYKRPRGRPRKQSIFHSLAGALGYIESKKKGGRPPKYTASEMEVMLEGLNRNKAELALQIGKKFISDRQYFEHIVNQDEPRMRLDKKRRVIEDLWKVIKYFRDQTGIREKKKSGKPRKK